MTEYKGSENGSAKDSSDIQEPNYTHSCFVKNNSCGCPNDFFEIRKLSKNSFFMIHWCASIYGMTYASIAAAIISSLNVSSTYMILSPAIGCGYCWTYIAYYELNGCQNTGCLCCGKKCCTDFSSHSTCLCCDKPCLSSL
jgi:hypothetical protein